MSSTQNSPPPTSGDAEALGQDPHPTVEETQPETQNLEPQHQTPLTSGDAEALGQDPHPTVEETQPENLEPQHQTPPTSVDAETLGQDPHPTVEETQPAQAETQNHQTSPTTGHHPTATGDAETLGQDAEEAQPAHAQVPAETQNPEPQLQTSLSSGHHPTATGDAGHPSVEETQPAAPEPNSATLQETTPTRPISPSPAARDDSTQAIRETGDTEPNPAPVADPRVQEITSVEKETDDAGVLEKSSTTHAQPPEEISKDTDLHTAPTEITADDEPKGQEISPANDEASSKASQIDSGNQIPGKEGVKNFEQPPLRASLWKKICDAFQNKSLTLKRSASGRGRQADRERSKSTSPSTTSGDPKPVSTTIQAGSDEKPNQDTLLKTIEADLDHVVQAATELNHYNEQLRRTVDEASKRFTDLQNKVKPEKVKDLEELKKAMTKLKLHIPPKYKVDLDQLKSSKMLQFDLKAKDGIPEEVVNNKPQLHKDVVFEGCVEFNDFEARYNELSTELKLCLLCFSIFPENAIIKKRLMVQWWVCEGFADEDRANGNFIQLMEKGFIAAVNKNKSCSVGSCLMHPFYRSVLITLAERARFFNFDSSGEPTQKFSGSFQACLVGDGVISYEDLKSELKKANSDKGTAKKEQVDLDEVLSKTLKKVHLLINVKETNLEFKPDWFSMMRNVNFIHLGSWRTTDHIEVENTKFLETVKHMKFLKFLSLQGVANVVTLPDSILKFSNLKILDLRACHNLESIPEGIGSLKSLTHLDMSDCYLLTHMPKSLSELTELEVLKGFVVGEENRTSSCTLNHLKKLKKLIKLCIFTDMRNFPNSDHHSALGELPSLCKLTITWGGTDPQEGSENSSDSPSKSQKLEGNNSDSLQLPSTLQKLDLKCFPKSTTPKWLAVEHLQHLEKLYIRGGKFSDLGQYQDIDDWNLVWPGKKETWKVKELRLKYLSEIEMEWRQLQELFPDLLYLEQVGCPKLTLFPCDANGVWINKRKK